MKIKPLIIATILLGLLLACSKEDGPKDPDSKPQTQKSSAKQISGFAFRAAENTVLENDIIGTIDQQTKAITVTVPTGTDVTALLPEMEVSPKASVNPVGTSNFKDSLNYTVTAEDGSTAIYTVAVNIAASGEKQILSFRFLGIVQDGVTIDITATIDEDKKTITAVMPSGTDITALAPNIEISPEATIGPEGPQDFTESMNYTVTAGNTASATYRVTLTVALTEKEVLLLIAEKNPNSFLEGWTKENSLEDFAGVTTDSDGKVIRLVLHGSELMVLPSEIGQLLGLIYLNLNDNKLNPIPGEIGQLVHLTELHLRNNQLGSIPAEIGQLDNLTELNLSSNQLVAIPPQIWELVNLESLILSNNGLKAIPPEIGQLANLEFLLLSNNKLMVVPLEIGQLVNLKKLQLNNNEINLIPPQIGQLAKLTELNLGFNELKAIPPEIGQLENLDFLLLNDNKLEAITSEIGQLSQLKALALAGNGLTVLPKAICDLDISRGGNTEVDIVPGINCGIVALKNQ